MFRFSIARLVLSHSWRMGLEVAGAVGWKNVEPLALIVSPVVFWMVKSRQRSSTHLLASSAWSWRVGY